MGLRGGGKRDGGGSRRTVRGVRGPQRYGRRGKGVSRSGDFVSPQALTRSHLPFLFRTFPLSLAAAADVETQRPTAPSRAADDGRSNGYAGTGHPGAGSGAGSGTGGREAVRKHRPHFRLLLVF